MMGFQLTRYDAARQALAEAHTIDEVKGLRDKALAIQAYAKQANDTDLEFNAAEIKIRAERRIGELLRDMDKAKGTAGQGRPNLGGTQKEPPKNDNPTLSDIGITKKQSSQWQRVAEVDEAEIEAAIAEGKKNHKPATAAQIVAKAIRNTRQKQKQADNAELIEVNETLAATDRKYHTIVLDPPWQMQKIDRDTAPNQVGFDYPTMTEAELEEIHIPAADHCHLFTWTTHKHLPTALRLLKVWGFKYVLTMVWHKPGGFQPFGLPQYNCEFVLYARKGAPEFLETKDFFTCFAAPRREHSRKPDKFYDVVRRVCDGPRIDIFSREARAGFDQYGNEVAKYSEVA